MNWILDKIMNFFFTDEVLDGFWDFEESNWYDSDEY